MEKYQNYVIDQFGNKITGVTVTVRDKDGVVAPIFSDQNLTSKSNPFTNDSEGGFDFYAANGRYIIDLTGPITRTITDVCLYDLNDKFEQYDFVDTELISVNGSSVQAMTLPMLAGQAYAIEYMMKFRNVQVADRIRINHSPAGGAGSDNAFFQLRWTEYTGSGSVVASENDMVPENTYAAYTPNTNGNEVAVHGRGMYSCGAAGDFILVFLQQFGSANNLYLSQGSWLRVTELGPIASVETV